MNVHTREIVNQSERERKNERAICFIKLLKGMQAIRERTCDLRARSPSLGSAYIYIFFSPILLFDGCEDCANVPECFYGGVHAVCCIRLCMVACAIFRCVLCTIGQVSWWACELNVARCMHIQIYQCTYYTLDVRPCALWYTYFAFSWAKMRHSILCVMCLCVVRCDWFCDMEWGAWLFAGSLILMVSRHSTPFKGETANVLQV